MKTMNELSVLIDTRTFTTSVGEVTLKPFKFKQFAVALAIVERYFMSLASFETNAEIATFLMSKASEDYQVLVDITTLLSLVSGLDKTAFDELQYDEVLSLLTEVIDMNLDFFSRIGETITKPKLEKENPTIGELELAA